MKILTILIAQGIDICTKNNGVNIDVNATCFLDGCREGHVKIVKLLIENGINITAKDRGGNTDFMFSYLKYVSQPYRKNIDDINVVKILTSLIAQGSDICTKNDFAQIVTNLKQICRKNNFSHMDYWNYLDGYGENPWAIDYRYFRLRLVRVKKFCEDLQCSIEKELEAVQTLQDILKEFLDYEHTCIVDVLTTFIFAKENLENSLMVLQNAIIVKETMKIYREKLNFDAYGNPYSCWSTYDEEWGCWEEDEV